MAVIGSWKIIPIDRPRRERCCSGRICRMSSPRNRIAPVTRADLGSRPITAMLDTDLPEPDSPTMPSTSPARRL